MVKVAGKGVPGAVGQGRAPLLPGLEVPRVHGTGQIRQGFGSGSQGKLDRNSARCLCSVAVCLEHLIELLWVSVLHIQRLMLSL